MALRQLDVTIKWAKQEGSVDPTLDLGARGLCLGGMGMISGDKLMG